MKTLCIEGWRGVNHSIAMVNQHQLLALLDEPGLRVYHRDQPYFMAHWNARQLPAGFAADEQERIQRVGPPPDGEPIDCLFRITSPFRTSFDPGQKTLSFMVTECWLVDPCFDRVPVEQAAFTRDANRIVTPSRWARERLIDYGFDGDRIHVVPHGVKAATFTPLGDEARRQARLHLGVAEGETLFLNVGVATWNKGLDLLIAAFAEVRGRHPHARLLIKENKGLYGLSVDRIVADLQRDRPGLMTEQVLAGISVISTPLDQQQLRTLYGVADAYVSPYRAEGFNLPVLEAMACGTPAIVTAGGATDDFCPDGLACRVPARAGTRDEVPQDVGPFLVPEHEALVQSMASVAEGGMPRDDALRRAQRAQLVQDFDWPAVTRRLATLF